ncbi:hypothetical protein PI124_g4984 [Phytophthora idaei]|nr:hypothetical protein PI125_g23017 [Phytophthora idaei]KAG3250374.1 hypothetical protein PI124_g4984 [Phytophthora idaei]
MNVGPFAAVAATGTTLVLATTMVVAPGASGVSGYAYDAASDTEGTAA